MKKMSTYMLPIIDALKNQENTHEGVLILPQRPRAIIFEPNKELA